MNRSTLTFMLLGKKHGFDMNRMVKFVMENQYWSQDQIIDYQTRWMRHMIAHAYAKTRFYRRIMDERGLAPSDIWELSDLKKLPTISKQDINPCWDDIIARDSARYKPMHRVTSGTTGVTFQYYNDVNSWGLNWATKIRTFSWGGYHFGRDRIATLKGGSMLARAKPSLKSKIWKWLHNYEDLPVVHLSLEAMESYYQCMVKQKIRFLRGFPSAVYTFAKYIHETHGGLPLSATFTSAELLHGYQRERIEATFGTKHIDAYGCGDGMGGANQCEHTKGYHANIETSILEVINAEGKDCRPGEEGEVVLTSLHDFAMPLIRYKPGDMAVVGAQKCPCGRTLPVLDKIVGRTSDLLVLPNGRTLNGIAIPFADWADRIEKFQLWHTAPDEIRLKIIAKPTLTESDVQHIHSIMIHHLGSGIRFGIDRVDDIPLTKSGKFKYVISLVDKP